MEFNLLIFILLSVMAEIAGTLGGFGSSVFFVPLANFYFAFESVLGLTATFHVLSNLTKIAFFRRGVDITLILYLGIPAIIFVVIGGLLTNYFSAIFLELALGFFLVTLSLLFLIKQKLVISSGKGEAFIGGSLSGFTAGLVGTGGAIRGLTMAAFNLEKHRFIATSAIIDLGVDLARSVVYFSNGFITKEVLQLLPFLFLASILGTYLGKKILNHIPQKHFKRLSLFLILFIGIITLVKVVMI